MAAVLLWIYLEGDDCRVKEDFLCVAALIGAMVTNSEPSAIRN